MDNQLATTNEDRSALELAGQAANGAAAAHVFDDYLSRKAENTIRNQRAALAVFVDYLKAAGVNGVTSDQMQHDPMAWEGVTWGIIEGFTKWLLSTGYSIATINNRLSAVKVYCKLAAKSGVIDPRELIMIKAVSGYRGTEAKRINEKREAQGQPTRVGPKKAEHVSLDPNQAKKLKSSHDQQTGQGRRDALLMTLLLDHGLRVSEVAGLQVTAFDLEAGKLQFYRPKVDKTQTHKMTADTLRAAMAYFQMDAPAMGRAILGSRKGGVLTNKPMSGRAITKRVADLGRRLLGIEEPPLSAHDCRYYWATDAARNKTDAFSLRNAGGWSSLAMPARYVEDAKIANEGVKLSGG